MKKILFAIISFCIPHLLFCIPYRLVRLVGPEKKVVDIIFDLHEDIDQPAPGTLKLTPKKRKKHFFFTLGQRKLVDQLHKRAKKQEPLDLVWELDSGTIKKKYPFEQDFLKGMGTHLAHTYNVAKKRSITFIPADNLRRLIYSFSQLRNLEKTEYPESLQQPLSEVGSYLAQVQELGDTYLAQIKPHVPMNNYKLLQKIWDAKVISGIKKIRKIVTQYNQKITIGTFFRQLKQNKQHERFADLWNSTITNQLPNLEMLIRIIGSPKKKVVVYAGGQHCNAITELLLKHFKFTKYIDIGYKRDSKKFIVFTLDHPIKPFLSAEGIAFVTAPVGDKVQQLLTKKNLDQFAKLFKITKEDQLIRHIQTLKPIFTNAFIDLFNLQNSNGKTFMHVAAKHGWSTAAQFILEQPNISLDIKDYAGETPLFKAVRHNHENIVTLLLEEGANPLVRNNKGKNTLDLAAGKPKLLRLLKSVVPQK